MATNDQAAIRFQALEKEYLEGFWRRPKLVLKGLSFEVPAGQIFGFLGANGAGKTTSIKVALGLQAATRGKVEIFGESVENAHSRSRIGFLPERPYFHLNLNAQEFLDFHRRLYGAPAPGRRRPTNGELLELVGLPEVGKKLLRNFSKGMLQRVGLAQALINDPDLVILDEPMSGLDPVGRREVRNLMVELNRRGKTIFFSSHILADIESICQRIAFLEKGELKYCGGIGELFARDSMEYEIIFRLDGAEAKRAELERLGRLHAHGQELRLSVAGEAEARRGAEKLWQLGASITSLGPAHRSLEDILFGNQKGGGNALGNPRDRA
jgi:ABC-2 type transport system ATP-binding protein